MKKQNVLILLIIMLFVSLKLSAADYIIPKNSKPVKIVVNNLLKTTASGKQTVELLILTATDNKALHKEQIYTARFLKRKGGQQDGTYNKSEEVIYIEQFSQVGTMEQQVTLKKIAKNMFVVVEATSYNRPSAVKRQHNFIQPVYYTQPVFSVPQIQSSQSF